MSAPFDFDFELNIGTAQRQRGDILATPRISIRKGVIKIGDYSLPPPWKPCADDGCARLSRIAKKRAPTEADAPLDNERPTTTYLSVAALPPAVTGSPRGTGEVPRCAGGASPCAQCSWSASFFQTKLKKWRALSQKRAEASCMQRPASGVAQSLGKRPVTRMPTGGDGLRCYLRRYLLNSHLSLSLTNGNNQAARSSIRACGSYSIKSALSLGSALPGRSIPSRPSACRR